LKVPDLHHLLEHMGFSADRLAIARIVAVQNVKTTLNCTNTPSHESFILPPPSHINDASGPLDLIKLWHYLKISCHACRAH
jgi:hypothetical protein